MEVYSLWLFLEGDARVQMNQREWHVREGMAFLVPPRCERHITTPNGAHWLSVCLRATLFGQVDLMQLMMPPVLWQPQKEAAALEEAMAGLAREWGGATPFPTVTPDTLDQYVKQHYLQLPAPDTTADLLCDCYARTIVGLCWRMLGKADLAQLAHQGMPPWLAAALQELGRNPDISVEQLAHQIGISPSHLRRHFHKLLGCSPREYLNRLRLDEARQLLENSDLPVTEIAERIGFLSAPHFNRLFKQTFGLPPAQYRHLSRLSKEK
jgi:AraC-like DNA-binding protein